MKSRCSNPNVPRWKDYGGRGIKVCKRWLESFEAFLEDVGARPEGTRGKRPLYSLGRIDNDGNYEPGNVAWQTPEEQNRNTRTSRLVKYRGVMMSIQSACAEAGITRGTFYARLRTGMSEHAALTAPDMTGRVKDGVLHPKKKSVTPPAGRSLR